MRKITLKLCGVVVLLAAWSCSTHRYQVTNVEKSRLLIDSRYDAKPNQDAFAFLAPYKQAVDSAMSPVVGTTARYMAASRPESELSNLLADILIWGAQAFNEKPDFAVYNMGGIRAAFAKGDITVGEVIDVAPFENKICFVTLTGADVMELFHQMARRYGEGVSSGVELLLSPEGELLRACLKGEEIDPQKQYRIATLDYLAQGNDGMPAFKKGTDVLSPQTEENNVRYIIMNYFREQTAQGKAVDAQKEGRIVVDGRPDFKEGH